MPQFGDTDVCEHCGEKIVFIRWWEHVEGRPRHPAKPKRVVSADREDFEKWRGENA